MQDLRPTPEQADLVERVLAAGVEALRKGLEASGAFTLASVRAAWDESRDAVEAFRAALADPEGARIFLPRKPKRPEEG